MTETISHYVRLLDHLAPPRLAESWDNVGLQVGNPRRTVKKIGVALDPLPKVVDRACSAQMDLLVTHHPLIFKPIKQILGDTPQGQAIETAIAHKLAIYCAHTNLDSVAGGVNDALARQVGLEHLRVLEGAGDAGLCKLVVFVPLDHLGTMFEQIKSLGIGRIDHYSCCTFRTRGVGTFLPGDHATPAVGEKGALNEVEEFRLEVLIPRTEASSVVDALEKAHPYETMAYDLYPVLADETTSGLGRVGYLDVPVSLDAFCERLKRTFFLPAVKVAGATIPEIKTVAVCSGSGSSLLSAAVASGAQAYVSGDLGYHAARDAQAAGICLIDIGHFASEHLIVDVLVKNLTEAIGNAGFTASVEAVGGESDPFRYR